MRQRTIHLTIWHELIQKLALSYNEESMLMAMYLLDDPDDLRRWWLSGEVKALKLPFLDYLKVPNSVHSEGRKIYRGVFGTASTKLFEKYEEKYRRSDKINCQTFG